MKLNKKLEAEVIQVYNTWWDSYLNGDVKTYDSFLEDDFRFIDLQKQKLFLNRKEATKFFKTTAYQFAGKIEKRNSSIKIEPVDGLVLITELSDAYFLNGAEWVFYSKFRFSSLLKKNKLGWKFVYQHFSMPDTKAQEGETIGFEKISNENLELREAVNRRTIELQGKNRELEIETALEKVRAIAMGMKEPADMLDVCKTISLQLQALGVKDIRNVQTAIFYPDKGTYMNYEYYARHHKTFITETIYTNHKIAKVFAAKMLKGKGEVSVTHIKGEKVKDWIAYQKSTNVFVDRFLEKASSLNYYWHSLGPVALGISSYSPLNKVDLNLFNRFLNVFELAYTRFLDIEQAIAQAKEARIEASLEKVRAQALGMRKPEELTNVCEILFNELQALGFPELRNAMVNIHNDEKRTFINYDYSDEIGKSITPLFYDIHPVIKKQIKQVRIADDAFSETVFKGKDLASWKAFRKSRGEKEDKRIKNSTALYYYFYSIGTGSIGISTFQAISEEKQEILKRFRNVFAFAYRRYMDVSLAEAQAKEAKIELSLERVRARSMAMHASDELVATSAVLFQELKTLGIETIRTGIGIIDEVQETVEIWSSQLIEQKENKVLGVVPVNMHPFFKGYFKAWKGKESFFSYGLAGDEVPRYYKTMSSIISYPAGKGFNPRETFYTFFFPEGSLNVIAYKSLSEEDCSIMIRFARVFGLIYRRFLDLQKAEAQAREAQIELSLERVRAGAMAMRQSAELSKLIVVLYQELTKLDAQLDRCFIMIVNPENQGITWWLAGKEGLMAENGFFIQMNQHPSHLMYLDHWQKRTKKWQYLFEGKEKRDWDKFGFNKTALAKLPEFIKKDMAGVKRIHLSGSSDQFGSLVTGSLEPLPEEHQDIISRFTIAFNQAYTRFLDLQNAEAQVREAQIEASLERVRSRSMAMHKSEELSELSLELVKQVQALGVATWFCAFNIYDDDSKSSLEWGSNGQGVFSKYRTPREGIFLRYYEAGQGGETLLINEIGEDQCPAHYEYLCSLPGVGDQLLKMKKAGIPFPTSQIDHVAFFKHGYIIFITFEPVPDTHDIFKRFAKVFEQSYTRFLDLQKVEAQAREAEIELGLERVRARAMAMQKSDELSALVDTLFKELTKLDFALNWCIINIIDEPSLTNRVWAANPETNKPPESYLMKFENYPFHHSMLKGYQERKTKHVYVIEGKEKTTYDNYLFNETEWRRVPQAAQDASRAMKRYVATFSFSNFGGLQTVGEEYLSEENLDILSRFGKVFDLTYTRFNDLKLAEASAREAQIEAALERVRSRTMAMQKSKELPEAANLLFHQVQALGMPAWSAGYCIWNDDGKSVTLWMSSEGVLQPPFTAPTTEDELFIQMREGHEMGKTLHVVEMGGKKLEAHYQYMRTLPVVGEIFDSILTAGHPLPSFQSCIMHTFPKGIYCSLLMNLFLMPMIFSNALRLSLTKPIPVSLISKKQKRRQEKHR
ncbi:MAG: nuclear transport factor 2 family protein [Chitinophagaceae bacterium]|nr:nuclear transport factor 2 family protein [Chitinophagaceae bacterium]